MARILFITPQELTQTTILGGNVDADKYKMCIEEAQIKTIEPLLGTLLYDKIVSDIINDSLTGLYLKIFEKFVKPITKYESVSDYIAISPYILANNGLYKHSDNNKEIVSQKEVGSLSEKYSTLAQLYVNKFNKFMRLNINNIPEYQTYQDEVNAQNINVNNGWYFDDL